MILRIFTAMIVFYFPTIAIGYIGLVGPPADGFTKYYNPNTQMWEITITDIYPNMNWVEIWSDSDTDDIAFIRSEVGSEYPAYLIMIIESNGHKVRDVYEVKQIGDASVSLSADISGDFGDAELYSMSIYSDQNIFGDIETTGVEYSYIGNLIAGGSITGNITSNSDRIAKISAGGTIGTPQSPITITSGSFIKEIIADSIYANINTGTSNFGHLETTGLTTDGDFDGSLTCDKLTSVSGYTDIVIAGSLDADITINDPDGLESYIIANAANDTTHLDHWSGDVTIDTTTLSPKPFYSNLSDDIGGAAVGVVPFMRHALDCVPPHGTAINDVLPDDVTIRHYGPVVYSGSDLPVTIWRKDITPPSQWEDVTANYDATITGANIILTPNGSNDWADGYDYLIQPVITGNDTLNCNVTGLPTVSSYLYVFRISIQ